MNKEKYRIKRVICSDGEFFVIEKRIFIFWWPLKAGTYVQADSLEEARELLKRAKNGDFETKTIYYSEKKLNELSTLKDIIQ